MNVQKMFLISEKDVELHIAEESFSGLMEVLHLCSCELFSPLMYSDDLPFSCPCD